MTIGSIIGAIIIGLVLGVLGRLFAPGKQNIPIWLTIVVGIVAAFIGTFIARALGVAVTRQPSAANGRTTTLCSMQCAANAAVRSPSATHTKLAWVGGTV